MSAHSSTETTPYYGLMAEFDSTQALLDAAHKVRAAGYTRTDAYSPMPIHGIAKRSSVTAPTSPQEIRGWHSFNPSLPAC